MFRFLLLATLLLVQLNASSVRVAPGEDVEFFETMLSNRTENALRICDMDHDRPEQASGPKTLLLFATQGHNLPLVVGSGGQLTFYGPTALHLLPSNAPDLAARIPPECLEACENHAIVLVARDEAECYTLSTFDFDETRQGYGSTCLYEEWDWTPGEEYCTGPLSVGADGVDVHNSSDVAIKLAFGGTLADGELRYTLLIDDAPVREWSHIDRLVIAGRSPNLYLITRRSGGKEELEHITVP